MNVIFNNIKLSGMAVALPSNKVQLTSLSSLYGGKEVDRIIASTGIESIRVASPDVNASDLCFQAAVNLLNHLKINSEEIDAIVFVSQTHDAVMPATSASLQHKLNMNTNAVAFDINYGCSGYLYGLYQAAMLLKSGGCKRVLLCAGDVITPLINPNDRHVRMIFGDAGSASILEHGDDTLGIVLKTDGSGKEHLCIDESGFLHMNGAAIMEFALRVVPEVIQELLTMQDLKYSDIGTFAFHQANQFMLNYLRKKMRLEKEAVPISMQDTGNTGPASIPLVLSRSFDELSKQDQLKKVVMCGFGVGLSWAAASLNLSNTVFLPPIEM